MTGGGVTLSGNITGTGNGILVQNNTAGTFTFKITDEADPKAVGDAATVTWAVRGVRFSKQGLAGDLNLSVTGPRAVCPFSLKNKPLVPLLDLPGQG